MNRFYISDLDGTLLKSDKSLSDYTRYSLLEIIEANISITVASARSIVTIRELIGDIPFKLPIIEMNGAIITEWATNEHVVVFDMNSDLSRDIYSILLQRSHSPIIVTVEGPKDKLYIPPPANPGMEDYYRERVKKGDHRVIDLVKSSTPFNERVIMFVVIDKHDKLADTELILKEEFNNTIDTHLMENFYFPGWDWLTIHDHRATKGNAVRALVNYIGFNDSEVVVFGDHTNDVSLFEAGDIKVAMGNATDGLKAIADVIAMTNEQDGVIKFIKDDMAAIKNERS